jgi:hypothetical protein
MHQAAEWGMRALQGRIPRLVFVSYQQPTWDFGFQAFLAFNFHVAEHLN